jgi:hypothetical protein
MAKFESNHVANHTSLTPPGQNHRTESGGCVIFYGGLCVAYWDAVLRILMLYPKILATLETVPLWLKFHRPSPILPVRHAPHAHL